LGLAIEGPVARIDFARDEQLNAYTRQMLDEITRAVAECEAAPEVRVVVLRGSERAFSSGADLHEVMPLIEGGDAQAFRDRWLAHVHGAADALERSRLVSVAVLEGFALAGGLELALACDLIVAADDARIGDQHLHFDLIPGGGGSQRLVRAIGPQRAKLLLYTARWISGAEAERIGLAARSAPASELEVVVEELVGLIARRGVEALRRTKELVNAAYEEGLSAGLARERELAGEHMVSDEARAGIERFRARAR
jgi:enoyl-CoA hydratase/carnithine racemase